MVNTDILKQIKQESINTNIPIIMDSTLKVITDYLKLIRPLSILEIGTAVGYSAICFAKYLNKDGKIDTIEIDEQKAKKAITNIQNMWTGK